MNNRQLYGRSHQPLKKLSDGDSHSVMIRKRWDVVRRIRLELKPHMPQDQVAKQLGLTRQAIEWIELRALYKIYAAFAAERRTHKQAKGM